MPTSPMMFSRVFVGFLLFLLPACSSHDIGEGTGGKGSGSGASGGSTGGTPGTGGLPAGTGGTLGGSGTVGTGGQAASTGGSRAGTGGVNSAGTGGSGTAGSGGRGGGDGGVQGGTSGAAGTGGGMAGTGGSPGAGGMDTNSYNPCPPPGEPCRVMPLGDSITQGTDGSSNGGGYRQTLFQLAHAAGKSILLVGSRSAGPTTVDGVAWPRNHEGYPGYTVSGLAGKTPNNIQTYKPNIVLLMIGTNDIAGGPGPTAKLASLVDTILNADPNLLLFVAQITPGQTFIMPTRYNPDVNAYNAAMVPMVNERAAAGKHIWLADMHTPFVSNPNYDTALLHNGIHPNDAGYKVMGETWYGLLKTLLR